MSTSWRAPPLLTRAHNRLVESLVLKMAQTPLPRPPPATIPKCWNDDAAKLIEPSTGTLEANVRVDRTLVPPTAMTPFATVTAGAPPPLDVVVKLSALTVLPLKSSRNWS